MIAWFARNSVAANLLMVLILALGAWSVTARIPLEVFPAFELDTVNVRVPFRGATPAEVEEGVVIRVEEAIQDLEGIKEIRSTASEGAGSVTVEVASGYDPRVLAEDIKNRVDGISTFPDETERPVTSVAQHLREVISVVVAGELPEGELRALGERMRDEILSLEPVTQAKLTAVRPYEISIEVAESTLQEYALQFPAIADAIRESSLDLSAGTLRTAGGEVLLRTRGQAYTARDFEAIPILKRADGTRLTIGDIAIVRDGFEDEPLAARFNGRPAVMIEVFRVGDQNAIDISSAVKSWVAETSATLPAGVELGYWRDRARIVNARLGTLLDSAAMGGVLIFLLLALFLRFSVALWVCVGIPISFMGALAVMPEMGVTINIVSLFAFILVLGIVVDDAIVTGENIYTHLRHETDSTRAAIAGTQEVAVPVTFGVLTTVAAFIPLLTIEGARGDIFAQIPLIVIPVLLFSLVESKLILPAHMRHVRVAAAGREQAGPLLRMQRRVADGLERFIDVAYRPLLESAMRNRYLTLSLFVGVAIVALSLVYSGWLRFTFFPRVQSETASAYLSMPVGTPFDITASHIERIEQAARRLQQKYVDPDTGKSVITNVFSIAGQAGSSGSASHVGRVMFEIEPPENRTAGITSTALVNEWRQAIGVIAGAQELSFRAEIGRGGSPLHVRLMGESFEDMRVIAGRVKERMATYPGVFDITDSFESGKEEVQLAIRPEAELLGLTMSDLARQVRYAFFGLEAQRIQRGREDVRVMVRYPPDERRSVGNLESMRIRTPAGEEVPFSTVARAEMGRSFASITRIDRNRTVNITADVDKESANIGAIKTDLVPFVAEQVARYPGVRFSLEGEAREQRESFGSLFYGTLFVLFTIYALLAIPFRSYVQPLIVMLVIPFGVCGAILGHLLLGMSLSILSLMGMLALAGVVINDSLVLVDYVNRRRREGMALTDAVRIAGVARFRPILLTSLTTFAGLMPLIFEKSTQAQFLIPMAVSLGFGILFATFITLLLVPINYLVLEDLRGLGRRRATGQAGA